MTHYQVAPWRAGIADWPGHSILERALHDLQELARWDPTGTLFELSREQREGMEGMEPEGPEEEEGEEKGKVCPA